MTFFYQGEINDGVIDLIKLIEESDDDEVILYFSSPGGDLALAYVMSDYLNRLGDRITVIAYWNIGSAAVEVLRQYKGKLNMLNDVWGLIHCATRPIDSRGIKEKESVDNYLIKEIDKWNMNIVVNIYGEHLSQSELRRIKKGGDVCIEHDRFVDFINKIREEAY
jgi:hypothetical protein